MSKDLTFDNFVKLNQFDIDNCNGGGLGGIVAGGIIGGAVGLIGSIIGNGTSITGSDIWRGYVTGASSGMYIGMYSPW